MRRRILVLLLILMGFGLTAEAKKKNAREIPNPEIPAHPNDLQYGDLDFTVPDGSSYRHTLSNGVVVYVAEDRSLPLVDINITLRAGSFLDPDGKFGLAEATGRMLRRGGAGSMSAEEFDEKVDFLAANMFTLGGGMSSRASLDCISPVLDEALDLFFDMLKSPRFQEDRIKVERDNLLEQMKQRNDQPQSISSREWNWLLYGMDHFSSRALTEADLNALTQEDLVGFHKKYWQPQNMIIGVSGDVDTKEVLAKLEQHFSGWDSEGPAVSWPPAAPTHVPVAGVYRVEKDIPQGRVVIGHLGMKRARWDDPDYFAISVMNDILGGGGFTSRLVKRIRSDEGLAYSAGSRAGVGTYWPGSFQMFYQSKSPTVALAAKIAIEELNRIRDEAVSDSEMETAKASFVDVFPRSFESAGDIVRLFTQGEYDSRPHNYWKEYQDNVRKVTAKDVQRVAQKYLDPEGLVFLIVGKWEDIQPGDADGRAEMGEFNGGKSTELPLRDPLTLKPMP